VILPEVQKMIAARDFAMLRKTFIEWHPADLAELLSDVGEGDQVVLFKLLPRELAANTFAYLCAARQKHLLKAMGQQEIARLLSVMSDDDRTTLLERLPGNLAASLIQLLTPDERSVAQALLNFPEDSVGRLMTPEFLAVPEEWTAQQVIDHIRTHGQDKETIHVVYVLDPSGKLIDDIRILQILLCSPDTPVREIRDEIFVALSVTDSQKTAIAQFRRYDGTSLPVIDSRGILLGIVTVDDVLDVQDEVATEEAQRFGGLDALDEPYISAPFWYLIRKRGGWLIILFIGEMFIATAMGFFSDQINKALVSSSVCSTHYFQRRQFWLPGCHLDRPGVGPWRGDAGRVVTSRASGNIFRFGTRRDHRDDRDVADCALAGDATHRLWAILASSCADNRCFPRWSRALGNSIGVYASVRIEALRSRPSNFLGTVCRNAS
jgi:magnesium transporter